ncbi:MAG TPA: hypothetical protein VKU00_18420 [Chthonomonadaceae bacterium]|nr:hypothetical protein [Chthonomonadaceae bacterium]
MATTWKPEYTTRAQESWEAYQQQHVLSDQLGKVAAIDPESGQFWIGDNGIDIADQERQE